MVKALTLATIFTAVDQMTGPMKKMKKGVLDMGQVVQGLNRGINIIAGAAAASLVVLAKKGLDLASDLTEVQNVVDTSFGLDGAGKINAWAQTAIKGFGLSELQAKKFAGTMGAMLKSSGLTGDSLGDMSVELASLAGDFASFYNLDAEEAFTKIRSGISGETEPLKQLGINMSVANLEAFALTKGIKKKWAAMKQGEQIQLRYAYLMQASSDAQGDFSKTLETSFANQKRVLATNIEQVAARAMKSALPIAIELAKKMNAITDKIGAWVEANQGLIAQKMEDIITGIYHAIEFITSPGVLKGMLALAVGIKAIGLATMVMGAGNPFILAIAATAALITLIVANWDKISAFFAGVSATNSKAGGSGNVSDYGNSGSAIDELYGAPGTESVPMAPAISSSSSSTVSRSELYVSLPEGTRSRQTGSAPGITVDTGRTIGGTR